MSRKNVLHLGIKFWPYSDEVINNTSLRGIRGGGMNKYCDMLINSLPQDIHSVILCQRLKGQKRHEVIGNVTVYRTRTFGSRAIRQIVANGLSFLTAFWIIPRERIDIIHGHLQTGTYFAYKLSRIFRKPIISTPYSFTTIGLNFIYNRICRYIESKYYKKVDMLVFESAENREKASDFMHIHFANSMVIHTGIMIPEDVETKPQQSKIQILYIGRLVKIKALDNLILSVTHLAPEIRSQLHINIAGEGELYEPLSRLVKENGISDCVTLHGYVKSSTEMYKSNDIFVLASHQEGLSVSLLEAMSYGLACIVNNYGVPFSKETVLEMENNDPATIAAAITSLVENPDLLEQYKRSARKEVLENFSIQRFAHKYSDLYESITYRHNSRKHKDFSFLALENLLLALKSQGYHFLTISEYQSKENEYQRFVMLRHDVETRYSNALRFAQLQHSLGIKGTFFFRLFPVVHNKFVITEIAKLGHEIGYHYDDLSESRGDVEKAIQRFEKNLTYLRQFGPVKTISMEGAPMSGHDNRNLWKHYNYRDFGITSEPYFDINFNEVLYLTDTGRRWDGYEVNVRDWIPGHQERWKALGLNWHTTDQLITAINASQLSDKVLMTFHPQRWNDKLVPWIRELILQKIKNVIKWVLIMVRRDNSYGSRR